MTPRLPRAAARRPDPERAPAALIGDGTRIPQSEGRLG